jgi:phage gp46-like protein
MPVEFSFTLPPDVPVVVEPSTPPTALLPAGARDLVGFGLLTPFRRSGGGQFLAGGGTLRLRSALQQTLGIRASTETEIGELAWRPEFGSKLHRLKHANHDLMTQEEAKLYVEEALGRWMPLIVVKDVVPLPPQEPHLNALYLRVKFDFVRTRGPGSNVILRDLFLDLPVYN